MIVLVFQPQHPCGNTEKHLPFPGVAQALVASQTKLIKIQNEMNKPHRLLLFCSYCLLFFVRIVKMPDSITFILGLSLSDRIEWVCICSCFFEHLPGEWSSNTVFEIFTFCVWERKMAAFSSVLFLCHLAHPYVFGKISLCNPNYCASLLGINEKILVLCESVLCCGGHDGHSFQNPAHPLPGRNFWALTLKPELLLPWQFFNPLGKLPFFKN